MNVIHQGNLLFVTWFTYDSAGKQVWYVAPNAPRSAPGVYEGPLYSVTGPVFSSASWNSSAVVTTAVGQARLVFSSATEGVFTYTVGSVTQSKPITRHVFSGPLATCR